MTWTSVAFAPCLFCGFSAQVPVPMRRPAAPALSSGRLLFSLPVLTRGPNSRIRGTGNTACITRAATSEPETLSSHRSLDEGPAPPQSRAAGEENSPPPPQLSFPSTCMHTHTSCTHAHTRAEYTPKHTCAHTKCPPRSHVCSQAPREGAEPGQVGTRTRLQPEVRREARGPPALVRPEGRLVAQPLLARGQSPVLLQSGLCLCHRARHLRSRKSGGRPAEPRAAPSEPASPAPARRPSESRVPHSLQLGRPRRRPREPRAAGKIPRSPRAGSCSVPGSLLHTLPVSVGERWCKGRSSAGRKAAGPGPGGRPCAGRASPRAAPRSAGSVPVAARQSSSEQGPPPEAGGSRPEPRR